MKQLFIITIAPLLLCCNPRNCEKKIATAFIEGDRIAPIVEWTITILDAKGNQVHTFSTRNLETNYQFANGSTARVAIKAWDERTGIKEVKYLVTDCDTPPVLDYKIIPNIPTPDNKILCELKFELVQRFCRETMLDLELIAIDYNNQSARHRLMILQ